MVEFRSPKPAVGGSIPSAPASVIGLFFEGMEMSSKSGIGKFFSFIGDVRSEIDKIAWPSRKEVVVTTVIVFIIALIASLFFALVDTAWYKIVHAIIGK